MITKRFETGLISILTDGQIQVRQDTVIEEDGKELNRTYHRLVLSPGDDVSTFPDARITAITKILWTEDVINAYKEKLAKPISLPGIAI